MISHIPAKLWINGEWVAAKDNKTFEVLNPIDDSVIGHAAHGSVEDVDKAMEAASVAFESYRKTLPSQREAWLSKAADLIQERAEDYVNVLVDEVGSPVGKAKFEIKYAVEYLRASAGVPRRINGKTMPTDMPGRMSISTREPLGVVSSITPFNVPLIKGIKLTASPLATGNSVVHLPSQETPTIALLLAELYRDAGFPAGTYNVVTGFGEEIGDHMNGHDATRAVMFTGSSRVGLHIAQLCGARMKRVLLELGGKSPLVVMKDADLDKAVHAAAMACFFFQGQGCMVTSRIYVEEDIWDVFMEKLQEEAKKFRSGDLREPGVLVGPLISARQRDRVKGHIEEAREKGATVFGGDWKGHACQPTVLTNVTKEMTVCTEETFGPVTSVYPFKGLEDGLAKANDTRFGLTAAIFTNDVNTALTYVQEIKSGMVHINAPTFADEPHVPFGGVGESGMGRESTEDDIELLTEQKWITVQLPDRTAKMGPQA